MQALMLRCAECGEQKRLPSATVETVMIATSGDVEEMPSMDITDIKETYSPLS
jgi:hypothetical protein